MKKSLKRIISLITLVACLAASLVIPSNAAITTADVTVAMDYYANNVYQSGRYWDGGNLNTSYASPQCSYRSCTCNTYQGASQCHGFALYLASLLTGTAPKGTLASYTNGLKSGSWTCYTLSALGYSGLAAVGLQPGDIVRASTDSKYADGHTAVVWKIEGGKVFFAECWGDKHCKLYWGGFNYYSYSLSAICSRYSYVAVWRNSSILPSDTVTQPALCNHSYVEDSDTAHPHPAFMKCTKCNDTYYTGSNAFDPECLCCTGVHSWNYIYDTAHPHAETKSCSGCGAREITGNVRHDPDCTVCQGPPYDLVLKVNSDKVALGSLASFEVKAGNADLLELDIYKNGMLYATLAVDTGTVNYRVGEAGVYTARLRASNAKGESITDMSSAFVADATVVSVVASGDEILITYSDPLKRTDAERFSDARSARLAEFGGSGFTIAVGADDFVSINSGDTEYQLRRGEYSWNEANTIAEALGGKLATVYTDADSAVISSLLTAEALDSAWLGATDTATEGTWLWEDGRELGYTNWSLAHSNTVNTSANWLCSYRSGQWCEAVLQGDVKGFVIEYSSEFKYTVLDDATVRIDRYSAHTPDEVKQVVVPEAIDGYTVSSLGEGLLDGHNVSRITLPAGLEEIAHGALDEAAEIICPREGTTRLILDSAGLGYKFAIPFTDVADGKWYTDAVRYCYGNGVIEGTSGTTFEPSANMTRAMFVTVLCSMDGADRSLYTGSSFADVTEGKWYASSVEWAYQNGLASGDGVNFDPSGELGRQQLATFICAYARYKGEDIEATAALADLSVFTDAAEISSWALDAVTWAVARGLLSGTTETTLSPDLVATRSQVAQIVMKFSEGDGEAPRPTSGFPLAEIDCFSAHQTTRKSVG